MKVEKTYQTTDRHGKPDFFRQKKKKGTGFDLVLKEEREKIEVQTTGRTRESILQTV